MRPLPRASWLAAAALVLASVPAPGAPAPAPGADLTRYLPDDTASVIAINVKPILESALYKERYQKLVEGFLSGDLAQTWLKDGGIDPLKDVEQILVIPYPVDKEEEEVSGGDVAFIIRGRFDAAKVHAKLAERAKDKPSLVKIFNEGTAKIYKVGNGDGPAMAYLALMDNGMAILSGRKLAVADAVAKAAGKKQTKLKHAGLAKLLENLDPKDAVTWVALGDAVVGSTRQVEFANGMQIVKNVTYQRLRDEGIETLRATFRIAAGVQGKATLVATDADGGKRLTEAMAAGVAKGMEELSRQAARDKQFVPVVEAMKSVTVTGNGTTVTLAGKADADAMDVFVKNFGFAASAPVAAPAR
jgi:hypothetical protein